MTSAVWDAADGRLLLLKGESHGVAFTFHFHLSPSGLTGETCLPRCSRGGDLWRQVEEYVQETQRSHRRTLQEQGPLDGLGDEQNKS